MDCKFYQGIIARFTDAIGLGKIEEGYPGDTHLDLLYEHIAICEECRSFYREHFHTSIKKLGEKEVRLTGGQLTLLQMLHGGFCEESCDCLDVLINR